MHAEPKTMRDVVRALMNEGAEALLELQELRISVAQVLVSIGELGLTARGLALDVEKLSRTAGVSSIDSMHAVRARTTHLNQVVQQILEVFRQMERAMRGWGLDGFCSDEPTPDSRRRH